MSGRATDAETLKARKKHQCSWCGEEIQTGETYARYVFFGGDVPGTVKMHQECRVAMRGYSAQNRGWIEWQDGEFSRGCACENGRCECNKQTTGESE